MQEVQLHYLLLGGGILNIKMWNHALIARLLLFIQNCKLVLTLRMVKTQIDRLRCIHTPEMKDYINTICY